MRPLLIARKEGVVLSSQVGIWTLERICDLLTMGIVMGATLLLSAPVASTGVAGARMLHYLRAGGIILCAGGLLFAMMLIQIRRHAHIPITILFWLAKPFPERSRRILQSTGAKWIESFAAGLASIQGVNGWGLCAVLSLLVWIPVFLNFGLVIRAFGGPMANLGPEAIVLVVAVTAIGSLIQIPGVGGGFQIAVVLALTQLFGIPLETASMAGMLLWVVGFLIVLIPGLPLAAREGLTWRRLRYMVKAGA